MFRLICVVAGLAVAPLTSKPRSAPDAGTSVPKAAVTVAAPAADAGVAGVVAAAAPVAVRPVSARAAADNSEAVRLRAELAAMQQRMAMLEDTVEQQRAQNDQLQKVVQQLQTIREEQQAAADAKQQLDVAALQRTAQVRAAQAQLVWAAQQLQTGDTNITTALDAAQSAPMGPMAQQYLSLARNALYNEDLSVASSYLMQAISAAQNAPR